MLEKAAILDSDFTIKTALSKNSQDKPLADVVLELPYNFYCHEQNKIEVTDHANVASTWLADHIVSGKIHCISDLQILKMIKDSYRFLQNEAVKLFADWLKQACDVFTVSFYNEYYSELELLKNKEETISDDEFTAVVEGGDLRVGKGKNLGEIKDTLLALTLNQCLQMDCINFCSDDNRARRSLLGFSQQTSFPIRSISYLGFYWVAKQKELLSKKEETEYLNCWKSHTIGTDTTIKKNIHRLQPDYPKLSIDDLFEAIWKDEVVMVNDGYLVYKREIL